jgi:hypothetical protein
MKMSKKYLNKITKLNYSYSDSIFDFYLEAVETTVVSLSEESIRQIIKLLKKDFLQGIIDISIVSLVSHELWNISVNILSIKDYKLTSWLYDASELGYREKIFLKRIINSENSEDES